MDTTGSMGASITSLASGISTPLAAGAPPLLSAATPGAEAITAGAQGATAPITASGLSAPGLPAGSGASSAGISATNAPSGSPGLLNQLNTYAREYKPLIDLTRQGIGTATSGRRPGTPPLQVNTPQLPAVTPPPQLDRLAFLRAFGMQG